MRTLIHRRHSLRAPGAIHLTPEGVALAREVGRSSGRFDRVLTSPIPRAVETAEAMGYRVDARWPSLAAVPEEVAAFLEREQPSSFGEYARWSSTVHAVRAAADRFAATWAEELDRLPEGGRLLMVSHGVVIELGAVGALPEVAGAWGPVLAPLEGVRLDRDGGRWVRGEVLRLGRTGR